MEYKSPIKKLKLKNVKSVQAATPSGIYESKLAKPKGKLKSKLATPTMSEVGERGNLTDSDIAKFKKKKKLKLKMKEEKIGFDRSHMTPHELDQDTKKKRKLMMKKKAY